MVRWLDETPTGRIIARCTQDIRAIDGAVPSNLLLVIQLVMDCFISLGAIVLFTPIFALPGFAVGIVGAMLGNSYLRTQLSIKREMRFVANLLLSSNLTLSLAMPALRSFHTSMQPYMD